MWRAVAEAKLKAMCILQEMKQSLSTSKHCKSEELFNLGTEIKHTVAFSCTSAVQWAWSVQLLQMWK